MLHTSRYFEKCEAAGIDDIGIRIHLEAAKIMLETMNVSGEAEYPGIDQLI